MAMARWNKHKRRVGGRHSLSVNYIYSCYDDVGVVQPPYRLSVDIPSMFRHIAHPPRFVKRISILQNDYLPYFASFYILHNGSTILQIFEPFCILEGFAKGA
jgi:hypothetical protein